MRPFDELELAAIAVIMNYIDETDVDNPKFNCTIEKHFLNDEIHIYDLTIKRVDINQINEINKIINP